MQTRREIPVAISAVAVTNSGTFTKSSTGAIATDGGFSTTSDVNLASNITTVNNPISIGGNLTLAEASAPTLASGGGAISVTGTTDGTTSGVAETLTLNAGTGGSILLTGAVGGMALAVVVEIGSIPFQTKAKLPIEALFHNRIGVLWLMSVGILLAPAVEETIFRGYLYPVLARTLGVEGGILTTGFLFGLMHAPQLWGGWGQIGLMVLVGIVTSGEVAVRTWAGAACLIPRGENEHLLQLAGFELLSYEDLTESVVTVARRQAAAFEKYRNDIVGSMGQEIYDGLTSSTAMAETLADQKRLIRIAYLSRRAA